MDILMAQMLKALTKKSCWRKFQHHLTNDVVWNTEAIALYATINELHQKSGRDVSLRTVESMIRATYTGDRLEELVGCIQAVAVAEVEHEQANHAVATYIAQSKASKAAQLVLTHRNSPVFDYSVPARLLADAANITASTESICVEVRDAPLPGDAALARKAIPLGLSPELDACLMGGVGRGELLVVLAPFGRGKTSYLWRLAANATIGGHGVWAATLEIKPYKCYNRYYQCLTHMTNTELLNARRIIGRKRKKVRGHLWVNDYTYQDINPQIVQREVEIMREEGHPVDYVMIDYAEIMGKRLGNRNKHEFLGEMVVELRRVANALDVPVVTAWQVNRIGHNKFVFGPEDISESWEMIKHADIVLGLNQTEEESKHNVMRVKIMKQREDTGRPSVYLYSDLRRMKITALEGEQEV